MYINNTKHLHPKSNCCFLFDIPSNDLSDLNGPNRVETDDSNSEIADKVSSKFKYVKVVIFLGFNLYEVKKGLLLLQW